MEEQKITPMVALNTIYSATNNLTLTRIDHEYLVKCFTVLNKIVPNDEEELTNEKAFSASNGKKKELVNL